MRAAFPDVVIVAYSGWSRQEDVDAAIEAGADRFLTKPAKFDEIRKALLGRRRVKKRRSRTLC
jgi:ActR/RegA family two-component response regulator